MRSRQTRILVCTGAGCIASGALAISSALRKKISEKGLSGSCIVKETGCLGPCVAGPVIMMSPDGVLYCSVKPEDAGEIIERHVMGGKSVTRLLHRDPAAGKPVGEAEEMSFFRKQRKRVLRNCGVIDPGSIEEYIDTGGYQALTRVLDSLSPEEVIDEMKRSGLRGRGGAGFPTGLKWALAGKARGDMKYVLCNGDEGDPGAFMDRSILEGDPHSVIEGMIIAAYAVGSSQGYAYVRAEYPLAVERLQMAIDQAREYGFLSGDIMGTGFGFDLDIRKGSGAFVCGEETALIASIEGNRGEPRPRPPFPAEIGLWGKPTILNNVETYANVPLIMSMGADWYANLGTDKSRGTKVFALAGAITHSGLVEVPIGTTLGEIVYDIGGGVLDGKEFKAAQIGGPSGGCIPRKHLDVPVDYESLAELGAIMGSGGLIVLDEDSCMVDVSRYFLEFVQDESCGKCTPCRIGTKRMLEILDRICAGEGRKDDVECLERLGRFIKDAALCGLGQTAPNPVLSTIRHFREEYDEHINNRRCPAGKCTALIGYQIDPETCKGCGVCARKCPSGAISGEKKKAHVIDPQSCVRCGACVDICNFGAIRKI